MVVLRYTPAPLIALAVILLSGMVTAFQTAAGTPCTGNGACSFTYTNGNGNLVTVNGNCAPDGACADNGAICNSDDQCYDYCGSGTCGGLGAQCNTKAAFFSDQFDAACFTPMYTCTADGSQGTCVLAASQGASTKRRRHVDSLMAERTIRRQVKAADLRRRG